MDKKNEHITNQKNIVEYKKMGRSSSKLKALIKKNIIVLKRNKCTTLCEILYPIIIMVIILAVRKAFTIDDFEYEKEEKTTENFIRKRSVANVDINNPDINTTDNKTFLWNGLSILPALSICSSSNRLKVPRPLIGTIGIPQTIKDQIILDSIANQKIFKLLVTNETFKDFNSIDEMETYVKDPAFGTDKNPALCFSMRLEEKNNSYNYSLHYFDSIFKEGIKDLINIIGGPFDRFRSGPDMDSYKKYQNSGYTYIMKLINEYILKKETKNNNASINFGMVPMKYVNYKKDKFGVYVGFIIPFFIIIAYMSPLCLYVYRMVAEKESRAKEGMKIMGLGDGTYFLSYFLQFLIINVVVSLINSIILRLIFTKIPFYFIYLIFFLWSMNIFALAFFFQSFIDSTRFCLILSLLIYFIMFFLSMACMKDTAGKSVKVGLSFFPPVVIEVGIVMLAEFQSHFRKYKPRYFTNIYTNYSLFYMLLMLTVDFFIYIFLGYYLQNVLPHTYGIRKPFYYIFTLEYWSRKCSRRAKNKTKRVEIKEEKNFSQTNMQKTETAILENIPNNQDTFSDISKFTDYYKDDPNFEGEALYKDKTKKDDALRIKNIKKTFEDGKTAVNNVNLNFYKDEIFALLGHNGAGKTTLISMLTGLYEATEGNAYYDGDDILIGNNMDTFRTKLGICPQHDILFEDLTIKEHLEMFSIFKGVPSDFIEQEVTKSINDFQLNEIKDITIKDLSAGQKRQLSIAIALIGGSKVIFLDEPSSGMDITSRRNLWEILKRQLDQKIIILTTHYMEEASVLGNRIGIINEGRMKCIGTPLFLIERFGKFMSINVSKKEDANNINIINYINSKTNDTKIEVLSEEILFRIPKNNYSEGGNMDLGEFFTDLDNHLTELKIKSYSVSMPTLEDVFLNISSEDSKQLAQERKHFSNNDIENDKILFETDFRDDYTKKSKFCNDFKASFKRRIYFIIRDLKSFLMEVLCPILLVLIGLSISKVEFQWASESCNVDISIIGNQIVLFSSIQEIKNISEYHFSDEYKNVTCKTLPIDNFNQNQKPEAIRNFIEKVFETNKDTEDSDLKEVDMNDENYVGYFGALLMLQEENDNYEFVEAINARVGHGPFIYTFYFLKQIIQRAVGHKINLDFTHYPMPLTDVFKQKSDSTNNSLVVLFVATAFSIIPSSFITMYVRERLNNSKHLMRISGLNSYAYWIVNYIFELIKYYVVCGICLFLIWLFDYYKKYLFILYILYGPAMISSTYILSFFFNKESTAQNVIILLNFLIGALGSTVILMLRGLENEAHTVAKILEYFFSVMPSFCFNFGYHLLLNRIIIYVIDYETTWMFFKESEIIKKFNLLLAMVIYLILEVIIYTILVFIIESRYYSYSKPKDERIPTDIKDELVLEEIERANNNKIKIINENNIPNNYEYTVRIKNLRKEFNKSGGCCSKQEKIIAIKNLNFCVEPGECFGLLGLNGAGKTSTFKCITQEFSPNNGTIYINGKDTYNNFDKFKMLIGYCPQYEAIFEYLTVYENLEFYAKIKGIKQMYIHKLVNAMIDEMALNEYTKKISGKLSGGNKRKLSVAISLLANPQIVLLDEPSTGMDPEARRFMWSIIHKTSKLGKKSSVIMTTHSMDEAETLCKRIGIMVNGEFVCLGKASQIKDKYGYGYEIDIRIKPLTVQQQDEYIQILNNSDYNFPNDSINYYMNINSNLDINNNNNNIKYNRKTKLNLENIIDILKKLNKNNYIDELKEDRLGKKIVKDIELNGSIVLITLLNWIFFVKNAFKFIQNAKVYFEEIFLSEHIENNFLFKMKKGPNTKSIGFFFGLFEKHKEECFVTEYSIQPTSLEQIFNKFAKAQIAEQNSKKNNKNIIQQEEEVKNEILVDEELIQKVIS